ncbi:hypothetical protein [Roseixanthobacter glucoisosaccharinicivorans]|uniref:hypothetical protein n=1 Tax=Roseixanthobacter glucoisosaccharinicivorans TaxID=3119923 RepID=UPI00372B7ED8
MYRWQSNTPVSEPDVQELLDIRAALVDLSFHVKLLRLREAIRKAGFNPNQPRIPRNNPHGGQWAGPGGAGTAPSGSKPVTPPPAGPQLPPRGEGDPPRIIITPRPPEIGHNGGPPLEDPPAIPREAPPTAQDRMRVVRRAAGWLLRAMRYGPSPQAKLFAAAVEATVWIADLLIPHITAYLEPPKTLAELQARWMCLQQGPMCIILSSRRPQPQRAIPGR